MNYATPSDRARRLARASVVICLGLGVTLSAPPVAAQRPTDAELTARVDTYLTRLESLGYRGGVLVVRNGRTLVQRSVGLADAARGIRADTNTVYNIGSITKQFTAAAILRLEELGKLRTTDSIGRFFPNAPADKRGITLHQLLTHTAGFASDYSPTDYEPTTRDEYVRRMLAATLRSAPGTQFAYANSGYSLLAAIVEVVTGQEYEQALRELVLTRAGMRETGYKAPAWPAARIAHGYQNGRDWGTIVDRIGAPGAPYWALRGNGGLHTTLDDMARWDAALYDNRLFTDSSRTKFMTGYVNEGPLGLSQYAYGWAVMKTPRGTRLVTHNGGNGIYVAELLRFVDEHVTVFVTSTVSEQTATPVANTLAKIAFGEPYELPPARVAVSAAALTAAEGTYRLADSSKLVLRVRDGRLFAEAVGQQAFMLLASGDTISPKPVTALNARARDIVAALLAANVQPLMRALGPGGPDSAEVARQESQLAASRRERFGVFRNFEVLGTAPGPEGDLRTTVRLSYENGAATNLYTWDRDGRIMDLGARPYEVVELVPTASGEFQSLKAGGAPALRMRFVGGRAEAVTARGVVGLRAGS